MWAVRYTVRVPACTGNEALYEPQLKVFTKSSRFRDICPWHLETCILHWQYNSAVMPSGQNDESHTLHPSLTRCELVFGKDLTNLGSATAKRIFSLTLREGY